MAPLHKHVGLSELILPALAARMREDGDLVDLALIDGGHEYPTVFVDFCYMNMVLRKGGHLVIDDLQLHAPKELARFLSQSGDFEPAADLAKSLVLRKKVDRPLVNRYSKYLVNMTRSYETQHNPYALF